MWQFRQMSGITTNTPAQILPLNPFSAVVEKGDLQKKYARKQGLCLGTF